MKNSSKLLTKMFLLGSLMAAPVIADTTGTLYLQGQVEPVLSVEVIEKDNAANLDLHTTQTDLHVANVVEKSNSYAGYQIFVRSENGGNLIHEGGASVDKVTYTVGYGDLNQQIPANDTLAAETNSTQIDNKSRKVLVSYTGRAAEEMVSGTYSDTLTFTIQSK